MLRSLLKPENLHGNSFWDLRYSPDNKKLFVIHSGPSILEWDLEKEEVLNVIQTEGKNEIYDFSSFGGCTSDGKKGQL